MLTPPQTLASPNSSNALERLSVLAPIERPRCLIAEAGLRLRLTQSPPQEEEADEDEEEEEEDEDEEEEE